MNTPKLAAPSAREAKELLKYIDRLAALKAGSSSAMPLNTFRSDAMRSALVKELANIAKNYNPSKVPDFLPFAKAMLKRTAGKFAHRQARKQLALAENSSGYASLDAPLESADSPDASMHDILADAESAARGIRGERLRRFYRVLAALPSADRRLLEVLMDCNLVQAKASQELGIPCHVFRKRRASAFARFRSLWRLAD